MLIERVQVEEGFLDGLDVVLSQGLNIMIGERGTGKTSLIELIRFCLGVQGYTAESRKRSMDHALSVLGSGQVTITLREGDREILVTRTASDQFPRTSAPYTHPLIFSQTEIETVGLQAQGRIRLVDSFSGEQAVLEGRESTAVSEVQSFTTQAEELRREIDEIANQVDELSVIDTQMADLDPQEKKLAKVLADAKEKKSELDTLSGQIAAAAVSVAAIDRFLDSVSKWERPISVVASAPLLESWPEGANADPLGECRRRVERAELHLVDALNELRAATEEAEDQHRLMEENKLALEDRARQLRTHVDAVQQGAGAILRRGQHLRERKAGLEALQTLLSHRRSTLAEILKQRDAALDKLDAVREARFASRSSVATRLTQTLGPRIRVKVARAGQYGTYAGSIADLLRGSGLRYSELSLAIAANVSPRELLEAADRNDFDLLAEAAGITTDRATRALSQLREADLGALATVAVEDTVELQLLDGTSYKAIGELSTGQRCTVVLPLVLQDTGRVLVVDQPEDHIDNAFIADTLIVSILSRTRSGQIIFSTHNANIPVLGDADRVFQLGSDGRRGFLILSSTLADPDVVRAISSVMEGGAEAFRRRVDFYSQYEGL